MPIDAQEVARKHLDHVSHALSDPEPCSMQWVAFQLVSALVHAICDVADAIRAPRRSS